MRVLARLCATFIVLLASRFARAGFTSDNEQGWTIHLDDDLVAKDPELARKVRSELHERLREIEDLLPARRVQELRNIEIFVHATSTKASAEYALDNERVAAHSVDLGGAEDFLRSQRQVPSRVLHELVHGYHHQILGRSYEAIQAAYDHAVSAHLYEGVATSAGKTASKSYALTNPAEFFALATQAYYERSGFYPFTRDDLRDYDSQTFRMIEEVWEERPGPQPARSISLKQLGLTCQPIEEPPTATRPLPSMLVVRNNSATALQLWWIDGARAKPYAVVPPAGVVLQKVLSPHVWELRTSDGSCAAALHVGPLGYHVTVVP